MMKYHLAAIRLGPSDIKYMKMMARRDGARRHGAEPVQ
jgi:hypothetical protein